MSLRLSISGIAKSYGGKHALRDCSYEFTTPSVFVLMGPNGSGKSTLLRICALLENPENGAVMYRNDSGLLPQDLALRRRMTLVLPKVGLFNASVERNVAYGLAVRRVDRRAMNERVASVLERVGLAHKRHQNALTLSSGEAQRTGIARALVIEPEVLFLDEPTASIDEQNTGIVEEIVLSLKREGRTMVIMTTHDRDQAERLADRLLLLREGRIEEAGSGRPLDITAPSV